MSKRRLSRLEQTALSVIWSLWTTRRKRATEDDLRRLVPLRSCAEAKRLLTNMVANRIITVSTKRICVLIPISHIEV
jgi:hypothetical protein